MCRSEARVESSSIGKRIRNVDVRTKKQTRFTTFTSPPTDQSCLQTLNAVCGATLSGSKGTLKDAEKSWIGLFGNNKSQAMMLITRSTGIPLPPRLCARITELLIHDARLPLLLSLQAARKAAYLKAIQSKEDSVVSEEAISASALQAVQRCRMEVVSATCERNLDAKERTFFVKIRLNKTGCDCCCGVPVTGEKELMGQGSVTIELSCCGREVRSIPCDEDCFSCAKHATVRRDTHLGGVVCENSVCVQDIKCKIKCTHVEPTAKGEKPKFVDRYQHELPLTVWEQRMLSQVCCMASVLHLQLREILSHSEQLSKTSKETWKTLFERRCTSLLKHQGKSLIEMDARLALVRPKECSMDDVRLSENNEDTSFFTRVLSGEYVAKDADGSLQPNTCAGSSHNRLVGRRVISKRNSKGEVPSESSIRIVRKDGAPDKWILTPSAKRRARLFPTTRVF